MPKIIIIPHYHYESQFAAFLNKTNAVQGDFSFYLLPPQNSDPSSPLALPSSDYSTILKFLFSQKQKMGFTDEDMLVAFYDGKISAREYALSNLFIAGANIEDQYPLQQ